MFDAFDRRTVLSGLATLSAIGGTAIASSAAMANASTLAKIGAAEKRCDDAKQAFEAALAAYAASWPAPHWSIDSRRNSLCRRSISTSFRFPAGPRFLPDARCIDDDFRDFWLANQDDYEACRGARRLRRRLQARVKRHRQRVAAHVEHHRLDELQSAKSMADAEILKLVEEVFKHPAATSAEVHTQAKALRALGSSLGDRNDWSTHRAGILGRQLANSLCELEAA